MSLKNGALNSALLELRGLVHDLLRKEAKGACLACGADSNEKIRMEIQLHKTAEQNEKLERRLKEAQDLAKRKDDEILDFKSKVNKKRPRLYCDSAETLLRLLRFLRLLRLLRLLRIC